MQRVSNYLLDREDEAILQNKQDNVDIDSDYIEDDVVSIVPTIAARTIRRTRRARRAHRSSVRAGATLSISDVHEDRAEQHVPSLPSPTSQDEEQLSVVTPASAQNHGDMRRKDENVYIVSRAKSPKVKPMFTTEEYALDHLLVLMDTNQLQLDLPYKKEHIWDCEHQSKLLHSIYQGFGIAPIVLNKKAHDRLPDGEILYRYRCVDGRQRLDAIAAFVKGFVPATTQNGTSPRYFLDNASVDRDRKALLSTAEQRAFWQMRIRCDVYDDLTEEQEIQMYHLKNNIDLYAPTAEKAAVTAVPGPRATNKAARSAEGTANKVQIVEVTKAQKGFWQTLAASYEEMYPEVLATTCFKKGSRFKDLVGIFAQILECSRASEADHASLFVNNFLELEEDCAEANVTLMQTVFDTYDRLVTAHPDVFIGSHLKAQGFAGRIYFTPIEFRAVAVLIAQHPNRSVDELAPIVHGLRVALRSGHESLAASPDVWSTAWDCIWSSFSTAAVDPGLDDVVESTSQVSLEPSLEPRSIVRSMKPSEPERPSVSSPLNIMRAEANKAKTAARSFSESRSPSKSTQIPRSSNRGQAQGPQPAVMAIRDTSQSPRMLSNDTVRQESQQCLFVEQDEDMSDVPARAPVATMTSLASVAAHSSLAASSLEPSQSSQASALRDWDAGQEDRLQAEQDATARRTNVIHMNPSVANWRGNGRLSHPIGQKSPTSPKRKSATLSSPLISNARREKAPRLSSHMKKIVRT